jgi:hypothetical protein
VPLGADQSILLHFPSKIRKIDTSCCHLPNDLSVEDTSDETVALSFSVNTIHHMMPNCSLLQGGQQIVTLSLFLVTLTRNKKSQAIFKLTSLSHTFIKVETFHPQAGLIQC